MIDTGATKSCISERYYQQLPSLKLQKLRNISVRSATGSNLTPLGMIHCSFKLGKIKFNSNLIVCRNLTRPLILGRDFLLQHYITVYEIEPSEMLHEKYPNLCIIPMMHNIDVHRTEHLPLVVINLASDDVYLSKGETMGFMQIQSLEISEIMTETSTEPSSIIYEDDNNEVLDVQEGEFEKENVEKKFITSPADIEVHRKVELQDADITDEQ